MLKGGGNNNYLRELSLKQITETVGSAASSRSSIDGGVNKRRAGPQLVDRSQVNRVKSQERASRFSNNVVDQRLRNVNKFILKQDADEGGEEDDAMSAEGEEYVDDGGMPKVKVKRKKVSPSRRKPQDYESPYAEYLLNAIKDNPTNDTKVMFSS